MNARGDLPGYGDLETCGPIRSTNDPRYCAEEMPPKQLTRLTDDVLEEWLSEPERFMSYEGDFSADEYAAINRATAAKDKDALMKARLGALANAMRVAAQQEALERYQRQIAEDELDAAIAAARSYA